MSVVSTIWLIINNKTNITEIKDQIEFVYGDLPPIQKIQFNETCQETIPGQVQPGQRALRFGKQIGISAIQFAERRNSFTFNCGRCDRR